MVELGIYATGLATPLSSTVQQNLAKQTSSGPGFVKSENPERLVVLIFTHNIPIALAEMIPLIGALSFVYSIYRTGLAAQVIVVSKGYPALIGIFLLAFPYSLVGLSSYAIAAGAGFMLFVSPLERRFRRELRTFALEGVVVTALLLLAAAMETITGIYPAVGFALWLPTGFAMAGVVLVTRKRWS
jgi:hypothetical protein